jgi:hypothetical protein
MLLIFMVSMGSRVANLIGASLISFITLWQSQASATLPQEVWVAIRSDNLPGSGTEDDPFNGTPQPQFDSVMNAIPDNTIIHLGPGVFETYGAMTWRPKNNWTIAGAGIDQTTLLQTAIQPGRFQVIQGSGSAQNLVVSDVTVDCNYINLSPTLVAADKGIGAVSAINGHLDNVKVIHAGGNHETFTLGFMQYGVGSTPPTSVLIENCRVEQSGPNVTAIYAHNTQTDEGYDPAPNAGQAVIRNCYVEGTGDFITGGIGFQVNGYQSALIDGCSTDGCTFGFYRDSFPQTGIVITNCNLNSLNGAITIAGGEQSWTRGVTVRQNALAAGQVIVNTASANDVTIQNNTFSPGPDYNNYWQPLQTACSTYIKNNHFDPAIVDGSQYVTDGRIDGNRYANGSLIPFLTDNRPPILHTSVDFNHDGHSDFALYGSVTRQTAIWYLNNNVYLGGAYAPTVPTGWELVAIGDFNRNGKPDYVLYKASTGQTAIWYLNNNVYVGGAYGPTLPTGWELVATGDFNRDGKPDYLLFNASTGQTAIWYLNNNVYGGGAYGPTLPSGWKLVDVADFNRDGEPDYLLFNPTTLQSAIWYLRNNNYVGGAYGPLVPAGWEIVSAGDFNGDTKPDCVLYQPATHRTAIWYLNNNVRIGAAYGPTLPCN